MANQHKFPLRGIRGVDDDTWQHFGTAVNQAGADRSTVVREFLRWYIHAAGAELPERPPPE